ncbi:hypothetical protein INR49_004651 [Caranx melampygus]|nr:hypothetical protein INR49_004651 [Caranx melampygus]
MEEPQSPSISRPQQVQRRAQIVSRRVTSLPLAVRNRRSWLRSGCKHEEDTALLTGLSFPECDIRQKVVAGDNPQKLEDVSEVGLITATLAL